MPNHVRVLTVSVMRGELSLAVHEEPLCGFVGFNGDDLLKDPSRPGVAVVCGGWHDEFVSRMPHNLWLICVFVVGEDVEHRVVRLIVAFKGKSVSRWLVTLVFDLF